MIDRVPVLSRDQSGAVPGTTRLPARRDRRAQPQPSGCACDVVCGSGRSTVSSDWTDHPAMRWSAMVKRPSACRRSVISSVSTMTPRLVV